MSSSSHVLLTLVVSSFCYGFGYMNRPDFSPVYLTLSPLYREETHSTKLIDREVQIHWDNGSVDTIALYNTNPSDAPEPVFQFNTLLYPEGYVDTNIAFGDPKFPGGWARDSNESIIPGDHCLPIWVLAYKDKELVHTDCLKIRPTWMQDNRLSVENLEITSLFIPGTHNSGSYGRAETSSQRDTSGRYILTQDQNIWQQLVYGIRYLDFRIGYYSQKKNGSEPTDDDSSFWINHDLIKIRKLTPLLKDIKDFLKRTKEEIIIVDFHRFPLGFSGRTSRHHQLVKLLEKELKEYAFPYKKNYIPTLGAILDQGKRLIISYGENNIATDYDWLWPPFRQLWGNKQTVDSLEEYLDRVMANTSVRDPARGPWAAMAQLTPGPLDLLFSPKGSLRIMASQVNSNLTRWCRDRWWPAANVVAVDFFLGTDLVNTAATANLFKGSNAKRYVT